MKANNVIILGPTPSQAETSFNLSKRGWTTSLTAIHRNTKLANSMKLKEGLFGLLFLGGCCSLGGISLVFWGVKHLGSGYVLRPSANRGPMGPEHAIFAGALCLIVGIAFLIRFFWRLRK